MNRIYLLFIFIFSFNLVLAQKDIEKNIISIPPSPTASELGKYGMIPVDEYNGLAQVNIPIYTFSVKDISVPISLSYHYNGLMPSARASWVGVGWSCGAGGLITRSMKGFPDESLNGYNNSLGFNGQQKAPDPINDPVNFKNYFENLPMATKVRFANGSWDSQPDSYYFNFQGKAGRLIFTDKGIKTVPYMPLIITKINDLWEIIDENGFKYIFGNDGTTNAVEITEPDDTQDPRISPFASSWYLISITSPNGAVVKFNYEGEGYRVIAPDFQRFARVNQVGSVCLVLQGLFTSVGNHSWINSKKLVSITSGQSRVSFVSKNQRQDTYIGEIAKQLDSIKVYYGNTEISRFSLQYSYLGERSSEETKIYKKLLLKKLIQENINGTPEEQYEFSYITGEIPELNTYAIDHWGYYNGKSNTTLIPSKLNSVNDTYFRNMALVGNRDADHNFAKIGLLQMIKYPTKGVQELIYEPNDYSLINGQPLQVEYSSTSMSVGANVSIPVSGPRATKEQKATFSIETAQIVEINHRITQLAQEGLGEQFVSLVKVGESVPIWLEGAASTQINTTSINLLPGSYVLTAHIEDKGYAADVNLNYEKFDQNAPVKIKKGGGFRIKTVKTYEDNNILLDRKDYDYRLSADTTLSTGILSFGARYEYPFRQTVEVPANSQPGDIEFIENRAICNCLVRNSNSIIPLSTGAISYVSYPQVKILNSLGGNGYVTKKFTSIGEYPNTTLPLGSPFADPILLDRFHGLLLNEETFDNKGRKLSTVQNTYTMNRESGAPNRFSIPYMAVSFDLEYPTYTSLNKFHSVLYGIETNWRYLNSTKRISYFYEPNAYSISTEDKYYYDNSVHTQLTRKERQISNGDNTFEYFSYPMDYTNGNVIIDLLKSKNVLTSPIEHVTVINSQAVGQRVISGQIFKYRTENAYKPAEVWDLETINPILLPGFKFSNRALGMIPPAGTIGSFVADSRYKMGYIVNRFDGYGNPQEIKKQEEPVTTYLWGYGGQFPIAEIKNATYSEVFDVLGQTTINNLNAFNVTETTINNAMSKLRTDSRLSKAMVTSYTYKPLVGMKSKTDARGVTEYYEYDGMQRLKAVLDQVKNVTSSMDYHYRPN